MGCERRCAPPVLSVIEIARLRETQRGDNGIAPLPASLAEALDALERDAG